MRQLQDKDKDKGQENHKTKLLLKLGKTIRKDKTRQKTRQEKTK